MKRAASATWAGVTMSARSGAPGMPSQSGVSTAPAESTPTRTPVPRSSSARTRPSPSRPYLEAVYAALPGRVRPVTMEPTRIRVPRPWPTMVGSTARQQR